MVNITDKAPTFWQLHNNPNINWDEQPRNIRWQEYQYQRMYAEMSAKIHPAIQGVMINVNFNNRFVNNTFIGGVVRAGAKTSFLVEVRCYVALLIQSHL